MKRGFKNPGSVTFILCLLNDIFTALAMVLYVLAEVFREIRQLYAELIAKKNWLVFLDINWLQPSEVRALWLKPVFMWVSMSRFWNAFLAAKC